MIYLFYTIHVIVCLFMILVVLLQQGKGADLSVFGGGSTQTAFGARGAATLLHKLTVISFVCFILTTLSIAVIKSTPGGTSVIADEEVATEEEAPAEEAATPADEAGGEPADGAALPAEEPPGTAAEPAGGDDAGGESGGGATSPPADGGGDAAPATPADGG